MAYFTGTECMICKERFRDDDDIVVCPECGTPYHRDCFAKEGRCINEKLHEQHKSWSEDMADSGAEQQKKCRYCGSVNKPHAIICESCGASLVDNLNFDNQQQGFSGGTGQQNMNQGGFNFDPSDKYCGMNPEESLDDGVKISEAADFVGSNVPYYLMLFKRMKDSGRKLTLNFICIFFPQFFFAHRKMWLEAVVMTLITTVLAIPKVLYTFISMDVPMGLFQSVNIDTPSFEIIFSLTNYASMALTVLSALFANWLYYRHMLRNVNKIKHQYGTDRSLLTEKIMRSGGTSVASVLVILTVQLALSAALVYGIMYI
ncbi:MAG: RING finger protein [Porcipelethomonas sp.]